MTEVVSHVEESDDLGRVGTSGIHRFYDVPLTMSDYSKRMGS